MHQTILERDPSAFRKYVILVYLLCATKIFLLVSIIVCVLFRKERAESASSEVHNRQKVKDLLGDMHQLKDFKDIDKSKKFTRSILFEQEQEKSQRLKEYQFQTLKPIEDFVRPDDQTSPRVTGYEHGHIRSLLKLDVFGPASSVAIEKDREAGLLPRSPNVDRHIVVNPSHTLTLRPGTGQSTTSSRASTAGSTSYNGAFPSLKMLRKERAAAASQSLDSAFTLSGKPSHPERTRNTISPTFGASTNNNSLDNASSHSREHASRTGSGHHHHHQHHGINMLNTAGAATEFAGPGLRPATGSTAGTGGRGSSHGTRPSSSAASFNGSGYGGEAGASARSKSRGKYPEQTFPGVAITEEERLLGGDPFLRRTMWYKQYASSRKVSCRIELHQCFFCCGGTVCIDAAEVARCTICWLNLLAVFSMPSCQSHSPHVFLSLTAGPSREQGDLQAGTAGGPRPVGNSRPGATAHEGV